MEHNALDRQGSEMIMNKVLKNHLTVGKENLTIFKLIDPDAGPYKTIQEAINAAEPGASIKIAPGLYTDNLVIEYKT